MKNSQNQLSPSQKATLRKVVSDPVRFAREILGVSLWEREIEILRSIATALNAPLSTFLEFEAQEIDTAILREKLNRVLDNRTTEQQQQALRVLKALFEP